MNKTICTILIALALFPSPCVFAESPANPPLHLKASAQALSEGDYEKARKILLIAREQNPKAYGIKYGLAVIAFSQGKRDEAATLLQESLSAGEMSADSHNLLGVINMQNGKTEEAILAFQAAVAAAPQNPQPLLNLAEAHRANNDPKLAYDPLRKLIARDPNQRSLYEMKLRFAQIDAGDLDEVVRSTDALIKEKGDQLSIDWVLTAAAISLRKGRMKEATTLLEQAKQVMPPDVFRNAMEDHAFKFFATESAMAPFYGTQRKSSGN